MPAPGQIAPHRDNAHFAKMLESLQSKDEPILAHEVAELRKEIAALRAELENCNSKYRRLFDAANNLCKVKGRYHSEIAMQRLMDACNVKRPEPIHQHSAREAPKPT